ARDRHRVDAGVAELRRGPHLGRGALSFVRDRPGEEGEDRELLLAAAAARIRDAEQARGSERRRETAARVAARAIGRREHAASAPGARHLVDAVDELLAVVRPGDGTLLRAGVRLDARLEQRAQDEPAPAARRAP